MADNLSQVAQAVLDRCLWHRTRMAARAITRYYDNAMRATGLRATQVSVLAMVAAKGELSISALSEQLGMDRTTLTRNLRPLEQRKLLALSSEGRHRVRLVRLTSAGRSALAEAVGYWELAQSAMERSLGDDGAASARASSDAIINSAAGNGVRSV